MARQILPIAGAVVGAAFGVPQLGFAIGSIIGNAVDPLQIQGPSIGDIAVQTSRDGVPRPIVFGVAAVFGNIVDRSEPKIVKKKERQGKGGPETVTEHVYMSFCIRIAEGPIVGVSRIWENEKLVYDVRPGSTIAADSAEFADKFTLYLGGETQLPDPTFEAIHGVGNTPAYRGTAYIVFSNKDLTEFGGAIPQYRFEVNGAAATPSGNVWLTYEGGLGDEFIGNYGGSSWTGITTDVGFALVGSFLKQGTKVYQYNIPASQFWYADESNYNDWTQISTPITPSAGGGRIISDGTYLYLAGGTAVVQRMTLPTGAFTDVSASAPEARGGGIVLHGGALYMSRNGSGEYDVNKSTDNGATWNPVGVISHDKVGVAYYASNGSRLIVCYERLSDSHVVIEYSDNNGVSWSGVVYTFPSPYTSFIDEVGSGLLYDGTHFVGILLNGKTAYSATGSSWTAGATIPRAMKYVSRGIGKIVAGCAYTELYETTDHGATWTQMTAPVGTGASTDNIYAYWIGDAP